MKGMVLNGVKAKRLAELSALTALALIIFVIELQIPNLSPIAGVKLGLANIVTVFAVYRYKASETALLLLARILLGSVFAGNPSAVLYSLAGGALCFAGMLLLKKIIPENHLWLCSVFGAVFHNIGQLAMAMLLMKTSAVFVYLPLLMLSGCIAGAFTGLCGQLVLKRLNKRSPSDKKGGRI